MTKAEKPQEQGYSKEQLIAAKKYADRRDMLGALLVDGKNYTNSMVEALCKAYREGRA